LGAQVVPESVQGGVLGEGGREPVAAGGGQALGAGGAGDDAVVAGHAGGLEPAHAVGDQLGLVGEVVVQNSVGERGVLGDGAQAGPRVAEFGQGQQRRVGEFAA